MIVLLEFDSTNKTNLPINVAAVSRLLVRVFIRNSGPKRRLARGCLLLEPAVLGEGKERNIISPVCEYALDSGAQSVVSDRNWGRPSLLLLGNDGLGVHT